MKLSNAEKLLIATIVLASGVLVAFAMGYIKIGGRVQDPALIELQRVIKADKEMLAKGDGTEDGISTALERLSIRTDPDAKEFIKKYWAHSSPQVKAAAVEAAGSFMKEPGFMEMIDFALKSSDEQIRMGALRALSRQGGVENEKRVIAFLNQKQMSENEAYQANFTLLKIATEPSTRGNALNALLRIANKTLESDPNKLLNLFLFAPKEPTLIARAKELFPQGPSPQLTARALQYLLANDRAWVETQLKSAPIHNDLKYQLVLIDALRAICPPDREELLAKIKSSPANADVGAAVEKFSCP